VYVAVCNDIPLAHQAVQACHASVAAGRDLVTCKEPYLVLVTVPDQYALVELSVRLSANGVAHTVFREDDMGGRPTALATGPLTQGDRKYFRELPLYCGSSSESHAKGLEEHSV
jgi:hypothetical protein